MAGSTVCRSHGGNAPQVREKARLRLLAATDPLAAELITIARDRKRADSDRIRAIVAVLDRAGLAPRDTQGPSVSELAEASGGEMYYLEEIERRRRIVAIRKAGGELEGSVAGPVNGKVNGHG